ncbi:hypothetical protein [Dankookia sp. P2]|uniref:hypothetical protein n=1 Tax=Dankookia sp. P2 TaxID=3423955 RepID=UPI003D66C110
MAEVDRSPAPRIFREAPVWAMRLFIGREPRAAAGLEFDHRHPDLEPLCRGFAATG